MIKALTTTLSLLCLLGTVFPLAAQPDPAQKAEEEAVRRQEAILQAQQSLARAQATLKQGDLLKSAKQFEESLAATEKVSVGLEKEHDQAVAGLAAVNLQLAQMAQRRGDYTEANNRVARILKVDPHNSAALHFKEGNDKIIESLRGRQPSPEAQSQVPAIAEEQIRVNTLVRDGKLLYEMGKLDEAEAKLTQAARADSENRVAFYYLSLVREARYDQEARKREDSSKQAIVEVEKAWNPPIKRDLLPVPNPMANPNLVYTGKGRQSIYQKLSQIHLKEVQFDGLPLSEVIKYLSDESKKLDPEKRGINFIINSNADSPSGAPSVTVDPTTGAAIPVPPAEPVDLNIVTIKILPPINDVTLAEVLDAISMVAEKPIKYSVEDYAVVFTQKRPEATQMYTRQWHVNPNTFIQGLESVSGISFGSLDTGSGGGQGGGGGQAGGGGRGAGGGQGGQGGEVGDVFVIPRVSLAQGGNLGGGGGAAGGGGGGGGQAGIAYVTITNEMRNVQETVRQFFITCGVNLAPPATLFYNDRSGILFVRAALQDLDLVESAIQVLNTAPPQVTIEVKFVEISQTDAKAVGFDWFIGNTLMNHQAIGIQAGTAPSFVGAPSPANPSGIFPGPSGTTGTVLPSTTDNLLSTGLRNLVGGGNTTALAQTPALATVTGILTDPQFRVVIRALEQRNGVDLLSAPKVTTLSARQTQIAVVDIRTVVTGVNLNQQTGGGGTTATGVAGTAGVVGTTANYLTQPLPFGPVLDVVPYVAADGYTIQMTIIPTLTEFIGYDDPGLFVPSAQGAAGNTVGIPLTATLPLPRLRSRQLATSCTVWDGQTIVLGGLISEDVVKFKDKIPVLGDMPLVGRLFRSESRSAVKRNLVIFVTPTIIDPAGNRVHTDEEMPFASTTIPPQQPFAR